MRLALFLLSGILLASPLHACPLPAASACPTIKKYIDYNCDGVLKIAFLGDSLVTGRGDTAHGERGGYVLRVRNRLKRRSSAVDVVGFGVPGQSTVNMIRDMLQEIQDPGTGPIEAALEGADLIVIDMGRNDWWLEVSPALTARNLRRILTLAERMGRSNGFTPTVVIARMIPTMRTELLNGINEHDFVLRVNAALMLLNQTRYPVVVPFDTLPLEGTLQSPPRVDAGLHPTPYGYNILAKIVMNFLGDGAQRLMTMRRPDTDGDNVFDFCESPRYYKTDPAAADTDEDGYSDGEEIYELYSDPLDPRVPGATISPTPTPTPEPV